MIRPLTEREVEVLALIASGFDYKSIADELDISLDTVKSHTKKIYAKLDAHNAPHAVTIGFAERIIKLPSPRVGGGRAMGPAASVANAERTQL